MINDLSANDIITPVIIAPSNNVIDFPINLVTRTISFITRSGTDTHQHSIWEIATDETFTNIDRRFEASGNTYFTAVNNLKNGTTYFLRVKYVGESGNESDWSSVIKITTIQDVTPEPIIAETPKVAYSTYTAIDVPVIPIVPDITPDVVPDIIPDVKPIVIDIETPEILELMNNATNVGTSFIVPVSEFIVLDGEDTHDYSQWAITTDSIFAFTETEYISTSGIYEQEIKSLRNGKIYYLRVRHVGKSGSKSKWSPTIKFTTISPI
jgi:hypothetical protein